MVKVEKLTPENCPGHKLELVYMGNPQIKKCICGYWECIDPQTQIIITRYKTIDNTKPGPVLSEYRS